MRRRFSAIHFRQLWFELFGRHFLCFSREPFGHVEPGFFMKPRVHEAPPDPRVRHQAQRMVACSLPRPQRLAVNIYYPQSQPRLAQSFLNTGYLHSTRCTPPVPAQACTEFPKHQACPEEYPLPAFSCTLLVCGLLPSACPPRLCCASSRSTPR